VAPPSGETCQLLCGQGRSIKQQQQQQLRVRACACVRFLSFVGCGCVDGSVAAGGVVRRVRELALVVWGVQRPQGLQYHHNITQPKCDIMPQRPHHRHHKHHWKVEMYHNEFVMIDPK
jgi:hypothetical protein